MKAIDLIRKFFRGEAGTATVDRAIIGGVLGIVIIALFTQLSTTTASTIQNIANTLTVAN
jgi:Flp pilus assembly pilin Flp